MGGGITIRDERTRDADGNPAVAFTNGHLAVRQSLLVRAEDAARLSDHQALTGRDNVATQVDTTGEARLLQLIGLTDAAGTLAAGTRVETTSGEVVADGSAAYFITAGDASPNLAGRRHLYPPNDTMPQVVYLVAELGEAELLDTLRRGDIDAIARNAIENRDAAHQSAGAFAISALDPVVEYVGFTVAVADADLLARLNERIDWPPIAATLGTPNGGPIPPYSRSGRSFGARSRRAV